MILKILELIYTYIITKILEYLGKKLHSFWLKVMPKIQMLFVVFTTFYMVKRRFPKGKGEGYLIAFALTVLIIVAYKLGKKSANTPTVI